MAHSIIISSDLLIIIIITIKQLEGNHSIYIYIEGIEGGIN